MENIAVTWCDHFRGCEEYHWNQHHFMAIYRMCDHGLEPSLGTCMACMVFKTSDLQQFTKTPETDWRRTGLDCSCWTFAMLCRGGPPSEQKMCWLKKRPVC